jgi:CTP synthase
MQEMGIQPDILVCRAPVMLDDSTRKKIALFTNVEPDAVFTSPNIDTTIYEGPIIFFNQKLDEVVLRKMGIENAHADMRPWHSVMERFAVRQGKVKIGIVGKYMELHDAYKSLYEALFHASLECGTEVELVKIDSAALEESENADNILGGQNRLDGILVPGGFGQRGINGMLKAAAWARVNKVPYLGICLGMYIMLIDWARNVLNWSEADSTEFNQNSKCPVVNHGETMRLGLSETTINKGTHLFTAYGKEQISERHRHRYELSNQYRDEIAASGLVLAAFNTDNTLVECIEWPETIHPWGVGIQFHPEFTSRPTAASPLFKDFITAAIKRIHKE